MSEATRQIIVERGPLAFGDTRLPDSFWDRCITKPDGGGCWLWLGRLDNKGYGRTQLGGGQLAHRLALSTVEALDGHLTVDHLCNTKRCVNPAHMEQVTSAENTKRHSIRTTVCVNGHPRPPGDCRECTRERQRRYRRRKRVQS